MNVLLLEKAVPGGQIIVTDWIENYPGFPEGISGFDLAEKMKLQAEEMGLKIETAEVHSLKLAKDKKEVVLADRTISTKSLIIASGASPKKLGIGEDRYMGKGISFCATCDAPFFKDKTVVAIGGGDTAVQESIYLTKFVKKVFLLHRRDQLRAAKILQERAFANSKIEILWDTVATGVEGLFGIEGVHVRNVKTGEEKTLKADGCFIWVGTLPNAEFLGDDIITDEYGFIRTDARMETNIPGVYAAGDIRDTPLRQVSTAVGDGAIATLAAEHYIENL
jgi:thioredoxin reductase (NADPH)